MPTSIARPRRRHLIAALVSPVLLLLTACGSDAGSDNLGDSGSARGPFPVTIDHAFGSTEIPQRPTRVLTLGLSDQDPLLALGVKPIAVSEWFGEYDHATWPWVQDELGDAEPVELNDGVRDEVNPPIEEIASLEPDLILSLCNGTTRKQYDQLSRIAPTVVPKKELQDFKITWQEATWVTGKAIGREDDARALVDELEQEFAAAAKHHPGFEGQQVVVAERFESGESVVRTGNDVRAQFFEDLGFITPTEAAGAKPDAFGEIKVSDELLGELSRDLLVWNIGSNPEVRETIEDIPLYARLPVVEKDRVVWVEDPVISGAFGWGTVLSLEFALDGLLPQIADAAT